MEYGHTAMLALNLLYSCKRWSYKHVQTYPASPNSSHYTDRHCPQSLNCLAEWFFWRAVWGHHCGELGGSWRSWTARPCLSARGLSRLGSCLCPGLTLTSSPGTHPRPVCVLARELVLFLSNSVRLLRASYSCSTLPCMETCSASLARLDKPGRLIPVFLL